MNEPLLNEQEAKQQARQAARNRNIAAVTGWALVGVGAGWHWSPGVGLLVAGGLLLAAATIGIVVASGVLSER